MGDDEVLQLEIKRPRYVSIDNALKQSIEHTPSPMSPQGHPRRTLPSTFTQSVSNNSQDLGPPYKFISRLIMHGNKILSNK